jgi:hypothetical protein
MLRDYGAIREILVKHDLDGKDLRLRQQVNRRRIAAHLENTLCRTFEASALIPEENPPALMQGKTRWQFGDGHLILSATLDRNARPTASISLAKEGRLEITSPVGPQIGRPTVWSTQRFNWSLSKCQDVCALNSSGLAIQVVVGGYGPVIEVLE